MKNKKIVFLYELRFTDRDIEKIGKDTYAFIATFAYAIDEIAVFRKLAIQSQGNQPKDQALLQMFAVQRNTIVRVLSAKLVEVIKFFGEYKKSLYNGKESENNEYLEALQPSIKALKEIRSSPYYNFSVKLRNNATNHYSFKDSLENLDKSVSPKASRSIFFTQDAGKYIFSAGRRGGFFGKMLEVFSRT